MSSINKHKNRINKCFKNIQCYLFGFKLGESCVKKFYYKLFFKEIQIIQKSLNLINNLLMVAADFF